MKILLTGFEPFNGSSSNPSSEIVRSFPDDQFLTHTIRKEILPVDSSKAVDVTKNLLDLLQPEIIFHLGEASTRSMVSLEKVAINWMDFRIADNSGAQIKDQQIVEGAPDAYFSSLPINQIRTAIKESGIPVEVSLSAGAYICNQVFFASMDYLKSMNSDAICGFIHLPSLPEQVVEKNNNSPSMSKEISLKAVVIAVETCLKYLSDS